MDELKHIMASHGPYWIVALVGAALAKLYSKEVQTIRTVLRSIISSLVLSFLLVEKFGSTYSAPELFVYVFIASILSDVVIEVIMGFGTKIKENPSIITAFWSKK